MSLKDLVGISFTAAGLLLLALGRSLLGPRALLYGFFLLALGILLIYLAKRRRHIDDTLDDLSFPGDGDYLSGSHGSDLPDHD